MHRRESKPPDVSHSLWTQRIYKWGRGWVSICWRYRQGLSQNKVDSSSLIGRRLSNSMASLGRTGALTVSILLWARKNSKVGFFLQLYLPLSANIPISGHRIKSHSPLSFLIATTKLCYQENIVLNRFILLFTWQMALSSNNVPGWETSD